MSIAGKHFYRFGYLKSSKWEAVRLEALARDNGKCRICGVQTNANDAHHIFYPDPVWETKREHLVTLCRPCHKIIHFMLPETAPTEEIGIKTFESVARALIDWEEAKKSRTLRELKSLKGCVGSCWFCRTQDSPYLPLQELEKHNLPAVLAQHPCCESCLSHIKTEMLEKQVKAWSIMRTMFGANRRKHLTK